jgi:hypothetical protein
MPTSKTVFSIEVTNKNYQIHYSGHFGVKWDELTERERKEVHKHDERIIRALIACPEAFDRLADFVHCIERFKRREAKKAQLKTL